MNDEKRRDNIPNNEQNSSEYRREQNEKTYTAMNKKKIIKIIVTVAIAALTALGAAIGLNSCNVVRTITNRSEFYQRGDTAVTIQTKTVESYDASRKY